MLEGLPWWKCHKRVQAVKIVDMIRRSGDRTALVYEDKSRSNGRWEVIVGPSYVEKHQPKIGGYYVRYIDGYESFSPATAFEEGYTRDV